MESVPALGGCLCVWWWRWVLVHRALGGRGWVRVLVLVCTWCGCGGSVGGRCAVAVHVAVCVVWLSVAGVCFAWMVWGLVGVGGVGVGVWGSVLVVGVSSVRCGRA